MVSDTTIDGLQLAAILLSPAVLCWVWARFTGQGQVRFWLRRTALIIVIGVIILFAIGFTVYGLCEGSQLKGFTSCHVIPVWLAKMGTLSWFLIPAVGVWTLGVWLWCAYLDMRAPR